MGAAVSNRDTFRHSPSLQLRPASINQTNYFHFRQARESEMLQIPCLVPSVLLICFLLPLVTHATYQPGSIGLNRVETSM